jgi:O-antigen/teichoic acid export membrane protein
MLKSLLKDGMWYGLSTIVLKGIGFFLMPLYLRVFTKTDYGTLEFISTVGSLISVFAGMGLTNVFFINFIHLKNKDEKIELLSIVTLFYTAWSAIIFSVYLCLVISGLVLETIPLIFKLLIVPIFFLTFFQELYFTYLRISRKVLPLSILQTSIGIVTIAFNVITILVFKLGIEMILLSQVLTLIVIVLCTGIYSFRSKFIKVKYFKWNKCKRYLIEGSTLVWGALAVYLQNQLDRWILAHYCSLEDVGVFSVAAKFSTIFNVLVLQTIINAYTPIMLQKYTAEDISTAEIEHQRNILIIFGIGLSCVALIYFFGRTLFTLYVGENYKDAFEPVCLLLTSQVLFLIVQLCGTLMVYLKKLKVLTIGVWVGAISTFTTNLLITPKMHVVGAAISNVVGMFFWLLLIWYGNFYYYKKFSCKILESK